MSGTDTPAAIWPLVAREEELELLDRVVDAGSDAPGRRADGERPSSAVVFGAAGVGKTRLARATLDRAAERGAATAWIVATRAGATVPYGAFAHLAPATAPSAGDDRFTMHSAFTDHLRQLADGRRLLLGIDDAQHLDPAGALLVLHLVVTGTATVVATIRSGEPTPDPVTALWRDELAVRLDLQRLSRADIAALAEAALGGPVGHPTVLRLDDLSSGNVLFVRELILAARASGDLRRVDGVWRWDGTLPAAQRLADVVGERLGDLTEDETRALSLVVLAEPIRLDLLESLVDVELIASLERHGLVTLETDDGDQRLRVAHPLHGEVLAQSISGVQRRLLTRRLADAMDDRVDLRFDERLRAVLWRLDADGHADPWLLTEAAQRVDAVFDYPLGERLGRAALDNGGGPDAALATAEALNHQNRFDEAEELLAEWEDRILASDDDATAGRYLAQRYGSLCTGLGHVDAMMAAFDRFSEAHPAPPWPARADAYRVKALVDLGRLADALAIGLPLMEDGSDEDARLIAVDSVSRALCYVGRTDTAQRMLTAAHEPAERRRADFPRVGAWIAAHEVMALFLDGQVAAAGALIEPFYEPIVRAGDDNARGVVALVIGRVEVMQGRLAEARNWMREAVAAMDLSDAAGYLPWALAILAQTEAMAGDPVAARRALTEGRDAARLSTALFEIDFALGEIWTLHAEGRDTDAVGRGTDLADALGEQPVMESLLRHATLRFGADAKPVAARLAEIADRCESELPHLLAEHARAVAGCDASALEAAAARFDELGIHLLAAEAAAQASATNRRQGLRGAARRTAALADRFWAMIDTPRTVRAADDDVAPLSRREREVAALAASGATNAEIAERLSVSVRTVESHLYNVFAKLGLERRDQLGGVLGPP